MTSVYYGRFTDGVFRKRFGFDLSFRAFGLRNWERVLRKMFWFGVEFSTCWTWRIRRRKLRLRLRLRT